MYTNSDIRARAWTLTKENLGRIAGIMLLIMAVPFVLMMIVITPIIISENAAASIGGMLLVYLIMLLVLPPVFFGCARTALGLWCSGRLNIKEMLYYLADLKRYGKSLLLMIVLGFASFVATVIPFVGPFIAIWVQFRLALAVWLFVSDERLNVIECVKFSFELMKGHCWRLFCMTFLLSLIWVGVILVLMVPVMAIGAIIDSVVLVILCLPLMLIGYAVFMPYYLMCVTGFAAELIPTPNIPVVSDTHDTYDRYRGPEL